MNFITTGEAARRCGVGINTIKRWMKKGELKYIVTPGGHWRIREHEFRTFLKTHNMDLLQEKEHTSEAHKILLIEDDLDMCALVEGAFDAATFNHTFDYAKDGYSGLIKLGLMQPDILILDIMLPEINGLEIIQRIRATDFHKKPKILVITGAGDRRLVRRALEKAKPDMILDKPFAVEDLIHATQKVLSSTSAVAAVNE
ncbi:response regulator [Ghiorsea bivora]|uniref:response regulator n=1 Tax=Ghiorsea bivora TaxID=1485545 RepID=UPI00069153CF|nr:response regulator [Ghiorsea bivora]